MGWNFAMVLNLPNGTSTKIRSAGKFVILQYMYMHLFYVSDILSLFFKLEPIQFFGASTKSQNKQECYHGNLTTLLFTGLSGFLIQREQSW